jgi:hypothetical protein
MLAPTATTFFALTLQYGFITGYYTGIGTSSNTSMYIIKPTTAGGTTYT